MTQAGEASVHTIDLGTPDLILETQGPVATLTFNRPQSRNAMTFAMYEGLVQVCDIVDSDPGLRVLLMKGAGAASATRSSRRRRIAGWIATLHDVVARNSVCGLPSRTSCLLVANRLRVPVPQ